MNKLLIVESPAKAKTLKKYLGKDFEILASYGHVRGLVKKDGSVDVNNHFAMRYQLLPKSAKHVDAILKAAKDAKHIYLATDPDREGESISWHLLELMRQKKVLGKQTVERVVFHEITQGAVRKAVEHPRAIDDHLVNAQQARSALDYLVGFNLSPLLWRKVRPGLSAGRVQSPALRLICEREAEIRAFSAREYWTIHLDTHQVSHSKGEKKHQPFRAKLASWQGQKLDQFDIPDAATQAALLAALESADQARVQTIEKKRKSRNPAPPFTTSTMQQEAVRKLGMSTDRTMRTAQNLYEGVATADGTVGLITYMRTDAVVLAAEALDEIRSYIGAHFPAEALPEKPVFYRNRSKNAQEAHEAIRPTSIARTPDALRAYLTPEQHRLYEMIWKRTVACQMAPARFDVTAVDIALQGKALEAAFLRSGALAEDSPLAGNKKSKSRGKKNDAMVDETTGGSAGLALFRASGQVMVFPGFLSVYEEDRDDPAEEEEGNARLPALREGEMLPVDRLSGEQHFTQPPPRFGEASLVKALEEFGIGRPSTYASIIQTLRKREYVELEQRRFTPTDTGEVVNKFLTDHFTQYVDYQFTSKLEDQLDEISTGQTDWVPVMESFWQPFSERVEEKKSLKRSEVTHEAMDETCPQCGKPLIVRLGRRGKFVGCSAYPECDYTRNLNETAEEAEAAASKAQEIIEGRSCPKDNGAMVLKHGRYGPFLGCANYPKCKHIEPLEKPKDSGVDCPLCKKGRLVEKKSRYGKLFYSCNTYPDCSYATWDPPIAESCPDCRWPVLTLKTTKRRGLEKVCPQKECGFKVQIETPEQRAAEADSTAIPKAAVPEVRSRPPAKKRRNAL